MNDPAPETPPLTTCVVCQDAAPSPSSGSAALCDSCRVASVQKTRKLTQTMALTPTESNPAASLYRVEAGDLLAQRFQVGRFLGSGGMGEVFEARDLVLNDRVALKIVHGHGAPVDNMSRLRREVQLARQVTHNNVCRIFDLIQHRDEETGDPLDLVSMELLEGETLRDVCDRRGRLSLRECLPIIRQVARGLSAAHRLGIVHRDLKPCNVMLVDEDGGQRAAITDFGLAHRFVGTEGVEGSDVFSGALVGTPAYIAPEQVDNEPTTPASDVYSFGTMFYEMLSGRLPFSAETPWLLVAQRMSVDPTPLKVQCPDLEPTILDLVDRCLQRNPAERFQSMGAILEQLDFGDTTWDVYGRKERSRPDSEGVEIALSQQSEPPSEVAPTAAPASSSEPLPSVEEDAVPVRREMAWSLGAGLAAAALLLAFSAFTNRSPAPTSSDLSLASQPAERPAVSNAEEILRRRSALEQGAEAGPKQPFGSLASMGIAVSDERFRDERPRSPAEALAWVQPRLAAYEWEDVVRVVGASLLSNPEDPLLLKTLATARWRQGRTEEARSAIAAATTFRRELAPRERLHLEGLEAGLDGDWERGRQLFQEAWLQDPGSLESGLWLIEATWLFGLSDPLTDLFSQLRAVAPDEVSHLHVDLWQSRISGGLGDVAEQERLAQQVVQGADRLGLPFLVLEGRSELADALGQKHEPFEYQQAVETFVRLAEASEDPLYLARAQQLEGYLDLRLGRHDEASSELEKADAAYAELGSLYGRCLVSNISGSIRLQPLDKKMRWLERGATYCEQGGFAGLHAFSIYLQARTWRDHGDFDRAMPLFRQSSDLTRGLDNHRQISRIHISLGNLLARLGRPREALETLELISDVGAGSSGREMRLMHLITTSNLMTHAGRMEEAAALLATAEELEPAGTLALDLVEVQCVYWLAQGDAEALAQGASVLDGMARNLVDRYRLENARGYHAQSLFLQGKYEESAAILAELDQEIHGFALAEAYYRLGRLEDAATALEEGMAYVRRLGFQPSLWMGEVLSARIEADADLEGSIARLQAVEEATSKTGSRLVHLEAALARGQITQDGALLRQVQRAARAHGLLRIATDAEAEIHRLQVLL